MNTDSKKEKKVRALGLCSGGLDSILSAYILIRQGIEVCWITFETPFFSSKKALEAANNSSIPIIVKDITDIYLDMLRDPKCGYGRWMNPCLDCRCLMFSQAFKIMKEKGFDFLFSGEVIGQRPMSQTKPSLRYTEKRSGAKDLILRPLSAKNLPETLPEKMGLVKRDMLCDISGRGRKKQIKLAEEFNIYDYPSPAGGCLLTDKEFCTRLNDLFENQEFFTKDDLNLLRYGRHFRILPNVKIVVGRMFEDNQNIERFAGNSVIVRLADYPGPLAAVSKDASYDEFKLAGSIIAGYAKNLDNKQVKIYIKLNDKVLNEKIISIKSEKIKDKMIRSKI